MTEDVTYHYLRTEGNHAVACIALRQKDMTYMAVGISMRSRKETTWDKKEMRAKATQRCNEAYRGETATTSSSLRNLPLLSHPFLGLKPPMDRLIPLLRPLIDLRRGTILLKGWITTSDYNTIMYRPG